MEVAEWTPRISDRAYFYLVARLSCPFCGTETRAKTIAQLFHGLPTATGGNIGDIDSGIRTVVENLSQQRACEHCGIVSIVPKADRLILLLEAQRRLTTDWFRTEVQRMGEEVASSAV